MKRLQNLFAAVAALALFAMMVLTFADVVGRKFFDHSLTGAVELTEIFMMVMIYFSLPLASIAGEHVVFDLLDRVMPAALLRWQRALSHTLTAIIFGGASWVVLQRAARPLEDGGEPATLGIKLGPCPHMVAVLLVLTAATHLWLAWRDLRGKDGR